MTKANPNESGLANVEIANQNIRKSALKDAEPQSAYADAVDTAPTEYETFDDQPLKVNERIEYDDRLTVISPSVVAYDFWKFAYIVPSKPNKPPFIKFDGLYLDGVIHRIENLGFRKRQTPGKKGDEKNQPWILIHADGAIIEPVEIGHIMNRFRGEHIDPLNSADAEKIEFSFREIQVSEYPLILSEKFIMQQHNIFNDKTLNFNIAPHEAPELKDGKTGAFFYFANTIVKVTKDGIQRLAYDQIDNACIWRSRLIAHPYQGNAEPGGHFETFIRNVSRADTDPDRFNAFRSAIGYLLHNYNSSAMGQAVIAYDESPARKNEPAGGTGKGLFANAIRQMRNTAKLDGKAIKDDDRFRWQEVSPQTQVVWLDDPKPTFNFELLYSNLTDGWNVEYKREHKIYIPPADSPKVFIATNTAINNAGSSNKRRQFIIEFSDHYSKRIQTGNEEPIKNEHGRVFFSDNPDDNWTAKDWQQFFAFMLDCVSYYLKNGLTPYQHKNVSRNQLVVSTSDDFAEWIDTEQIRTDGTEYDKNELFEGFKTTYLGNDTTFKQRTFTEWLKKWASIYGLTVDQRKSAGKGLILFRKKKAG